MPKQILATLRLFNRSIIDDEANDQVRDFTIHVLKKSILNTIKDASDESILEAIIIDIKDWPL